MMQDGRDRRMPRRAVLKGAAWSMPVVAVAVSVPARAASGACAGYEVSQSITKENGAWQYKDTITVTKDGAPVDLTGVVVTVTFADPVPPVKPTDAHGCSVVADGDTVVATGTGGETMDFALQLGSGNGEELDVGGVVSVSVPGCGVVIENQPFVFHVVKN